MTALHRRHNVGGSVSNHQRLHCLLKCRFRRRSKLRVTGLCAGNSLVTGECPAQKASNAEMLPFDDVIMETFATGDRCAQFIFDRKRWEILYTFHYLLWIWRSGPFPLKDFPSQFKFDANFLSLPPRFWYSDTNVDHSNVVRAAPTTSSFSN